MHPKAGAGCGEETLGKLRGGEGHRGGWTMVGGAGKCGVMADVKVLIQDVSGWLLLSYLARAFCSFACPPHPILLYFAHLMPYILSPSPSPSSSSLRSPITFSNERGLGAFTPLATLPRRKSQKKSLFHIPADDDHEPSPPPSPPLTTPDDIVQEGLPARISIPFPSSSPLPSPSLYPPNAPKFNRASSHVVLSSGKPLKSSLKSSSASSIADDYARARHARAQSEPATPALVPKNVHFKDQAEGLVSVRLFRRTGRPTAVSSPANPDDTETETEAEHASNSAFPFPRLPSSLSHAPLAEIDSDLARTSAIPAPSPDLYANIHLESISLPPSRPPILRGTALVRNISFEKQVGVRFTLDNWTTVSEVIGTYAGGVTHSEALAGISATGTVGDLVGALAAGPADPWDRFTFTIRLEDYEARLLERTLFLVARYTVQGQGEWWDNNSGANYRVGFRSRPSSAASDSSPATNARKRGVSVPLPSAGPFTMSAAAPPPQVTQHESRGTFSISKQQTSTLSPSPLVQSTASVALASRPPPLARAASMPMPFGTRLNLKHYAAPARVAVPGSNSLNSHLTSASIFSATFGARVVPPVAMGSTVKGRMLIHGHPATAIESPEEEIVQSPSVERESIGLGFLFTAQEQASQEDSMKTSSVKEDGEMAARFNADAHSPQSLDGSSSRPARPQLSLNVTPPTPSPPSTNNHSYLGSPERTSPIRSPTRSPNISPNTSQSQLALDPSAVNTSDSMYAAFLRQWCFAQSTPPAAHPRPGALGEVGFVVETPATPGAVGGIGFGMMNGVEAVGWVG